MKGENKAMKEYTIIEVKKARGNQGNCLACGKEIKTGDTFRRLSWPNPNKIFFCANCKVDQSLIGENRQNGKVREVLKIRTKGQTKSIASFITEKKPEASKHQPSAEEIEEEKMSEDSDVLAESCLEIPKAYCSKCKRYHEIGSRRYERHLIFLTK